jgi:Cys-rich four helix bundle protein (predicted Tat secretion target)
MTRRQLLLGAAYVVAASAAGARQAAAQGRGAPASLAQAVAGCIEAGNACMQHCLDLLAKGDESLGACAKSVHEMLAVCTATGVLLAGDSPLKARQVELCVAACAQCEQACEPHADHHAPCRRCRDACRATIVAARRAA